MNLIELCQQTEHRLAKIWLDVNQLKSASNVDNNRVFGEKLDDVKGYKYLGVLEDLLNVIKEENKVIMVDRVRERTSKLCQTKLNAVNLFRGINEVSTLNYYIGLLPYEPKEFDEINKKVRRILSAYKVTRNSANMDRMYLKRDRLFRGLTCLVEKAELMLLNLYEFLSKNPKTQALAEHEKNEASHLGLIRDYLEAKYRLTNSDG